MPKRQMDFEATLEKLGVRLRRGWVKLHPLKKKELQRVRAAVKAQWTQQQKTRKAFQRQLPARPEGTSVEMKAPESAGHQLAKTHKAIGDLNNLALHQKPKAEALLARKKSTRYTGPRLRGQSGATQPGQGQPATDPSAKPVPQAARKRK